MRTKQNWSGRWAALSVGFLSAVLASIASAQSPAGSEFQINSYTTGLQKFASVAADANGNFVVAWESPRDGSDYGVFARRFNAAGVAQGTEFQVNSYTTFIQAFPAVASDANGNFVVAWQSPHDGSDYGVFARRFNAAGVAQGTEFQVNSYTTFIQAFPAVASDANGNFVVTWQSQQDGSDYGVFARRFNTSGVAQGTEFQVNSYTTNDQSNPAVASDGSGNFVVVWEGNLQDGSGYGIFGRRFSSTGAALGSELSITPFSPGDQLFPSVASDAKGNFVTVWESYFQNGSGYDVFGRLFSAAGVPQTNEFQVNSYVTGDQRFPSVASDADGKFVVVWTGVGAQDDYGTFGRRFTAAGEPQGSEFPINSYTTGAQGGLPKIASDPDGDFVVVWTGGGEKDGSSYGIFGQRYGDRIFEDGFDSGDLTRWSSSSTDGGNLSVSPAAAMAGTANGMQALVNDTNSLYVQDDTPNAESRYRVRFYFDPNGFDPGEASGNFRTRIFIAFDGSSQRVITLVLKRQSGAYSLKGRVRLNDGSRADTPFFPISAGPHFFEFDWERSSAPGANDGHFTLQIDDVVDSQLTGLANDLSTVESARLGALSVKTGAGGTLFFDQFESRRERFIGPE